MSPLDALTIIILALFIIRGAWVGFIRQAASLFALALGFLMAGHYSGETTHLLTPFIHNKQLAFLVAYAIIFCLVFIITIFVGLAFKKVAQLILLDWFDRTLGGLLGAAKGLFLASLAFMGLTIFISGTSPVFTRSLLYPYLQKTTVVLLAVVKDDDLRNRLIPKQPAISNLLSNTVEFGQEIGRQAKQKPTDN